MQQQRYFSKRLKRKATCEGNASERSCQLLHDSSEIRNTWHNVPYWNQASSQKPRPFQLFDKTTGLFQSMNYVPTFPTGIEPLSLSSSSNETNGLSQNEDSVPNDDFALIILQICVPMTTASYWNESRQWLLLQFEWRHSTSSLFCNRGSGGKNVIFSNGPNSTSECSKLLY